MVFISEPELCHADRLRETEFKELTTNEEHHRRKYIQISRVKVKGRTGVGDFFGLS